MDMEMEMDSNMTKVDSLNVLDEIIDLLLGKKATPIAFLMHH
jgi:hypothetical protein